MKSPIQEQAVVLRNEEVGPRLWLLTVKSPQIAASIMPGQFVHMLIPGFDAHVLRRPFSAFDTNTESGEMVILYQLVGEGTRFMTGIKEGEVCDLIGPIGTGWSIPQRAKRVLLVGGGVGSAPLYLLARQAVEAGKRVDVILGAQTISALVTKEAFAKAIGHAPACATDDGSFGRAGFCTSLVDEMLADESDDPIDYLAVCGPEPLMRIVSGSALLKGIVCEVSTERRMACGIGACLSCVVETVDGKKRACVDGPVFDARKVVW